MVRPDPRTPRVQLSPECPECGHPYGTQIDTGWANDGTIHLRLYTCPEDCPTFITAEITLPRVATIAEFDDHYRERRRRHSRKVQGYKGTKPRGGTILRSAMLKVNTFVTPAVRLGAKKATND